MNFRQLQESDCFSVISVIDSWWDGRHMADMLPKLFFQHFQDTSFVVEENGQLVAFLVGFVSQTDADEAYIHFVGVHPEYRRHELARRLYDRFFTVVQDRGRNVVMCGIQTEVCVDTTCRRAFSLGYRVTLASDAHSTWPLGEL